MTHDFTLEDIGKVINRTVGESEERIMKSMDKKLESFLLEDVPADMRKTLMEFYGFKLPIVDVKNAEETIKYIESVKVA